MQTTPTPPIGNTKIRLLFLIFAILAFCTAGCFSMPPAEKRCERTAVIFGTVVRLSAMGDTAEIAVAECLDQLDALDRLFGADDPSAPLAKLRDAAGTGEWVAMPPKLWHILHLSQSYSAQTDGAWDITVGALSAIWKKSLVDGVPPSGEAVLTAREKIGWKKLDLRASDKSARLAEAGMSLDLGGVRKGFALDECRRIYAKHHVTGLIDLGESSIAAIGEKASGEPFRIALRHPRQESPARLGVLLMKDAALSTSGDYEHFFIADGARYHHILDTRTGFPAKSGVASVFVRIGAEEPDAGLISDMLSTAFFVLGTEKSLALLPSLPVRAEAVFADETGVAAGENFLRE